VDTEGTQRLIGFCVGLGTEEGGDHRPVVFPNLVGDGTPVGLVLFAVVGFGSDVPARGVTAEGCEKG
jgi:hypothetical protein